MSVKKRIKPGRIEPSADGHSIVVHFITEITHLDEDGNSLGTDKTPDMREVDVARQLQGLREQDIQALAQEIVEKCRYIPATKTRHVEQVLSKLLSASPPLDDSGARWRGKTSSAGKTCRASGARPMGLSAGVFHLPEDTRMSPAVEDTLHLSDLLPEACIANMDEYADELYEEQMESKTLGAQRLLRLSTEARQLVEISSHSTLLGVLSRELRENAKRSHELTVAITGIFLCLAHFPVFHPVLVHHQCGDVTMRVVEYESRRRNVLTKEIELKRGRLVALGSKASGAEAIELRREESRHRNVLDRQDRLLQLCLLVLRKLAEDLAVEKALVRRRICHFLIKLLDRSDEELLLVTLSFLHKLVAFEENKEQLVKESGALVRLAELACHPWSSVAILATRVCYNASFDRRARHILVGQTQLVTTLVASAKIRSTRKIALKLLYHLTMDNATRVAIAQRWPDCLTLALELVASGSSSSNKHVDREAAAICVNLAAHESCARAIVELEHFAQLAVRAVQFGDPLLLKVLRHISSHSTVRPRLLEVMAANANGGSTWLHEIVVLCTANSAGPDLLVEALGILANLDGVEVPWPDLVEAGLLELLHRLLTKGGISDDDVLLECVMLIGTLALDPWTAPLLAASQVPVALPSLVTDKHEDLDILVQLLFTLRCLLLNEDTCEVLLHDSDLPDRIMDLLREVGDRGGESPCWQAVRISATEVLELIIAADSQDPLRSRWADRIKAFRFQVHNDDWCQRVQTVERPQDIKGVSSAANSAMRWTDTDNLADRCWGNMPHSGFGKTTHSESPPLASHHNDSGSSLS